ncbi:hypothetical protein GUY40_01365 [Pseudomonas sp. R5(2019)]|nr:hypothetical protein [Pseudomonas sp. R5(2019)]
MTNASPQENSQGDEVVTLQRLLTQRGYPVAGSGFFDMATDRAVRAFQSQNLDQHGQPLVVDGKVGDLTWWRLNHPKPLILAPSAVDYTKLPSQANANNGYHIRGARP